MHKLGRRVVSNNPAKKASLLHGCNLALLGLLLCTSLLAGAQVEQERDQPVKRIEILSYEGQKVSSVELAGQPDLNKNEMMPLVALRDGDDLSAPKIDQTVEALRHSGKFTDVQVDLRP